MTRTPIWLLAAALPLAAAGGWALRGPSAPISAAAPDEHGDEHAGEAEGAAHADDEAGARAPAEEGVVRLDPVQVRAAAIGIETVSDAPATAEVTASGRIVPATAGQAAVTARAGGTVVRVLRTLGDPVRSGTPLAILDSREAAEARATHARAVRAEALANTGFAREERLYRERVTAAQDYQTAAAARDAARLDTRLAAEALSAIGAAPGGDLRRLTVTSPVAGAVVSIDTQPGATVAPGAPMFRVADQREVWAELLVPARDLARLARGGRARVTAQGEAHDHAGRILALSPTIDSATGAATAIVSVLNHGGELAVGKLVTARLATREPSTGAAALGIPRDALQEVEGRTVVFVRTPQGFIARRVNVAPGTGSVAQVLSGVRAGERIAVANSFILKAELGKSEAEHEH